MRYIYIILFFLYTFSLTAKANQQDQIRLNYPYINYTTKNGLPSNETYCILQDSRGYIWIGTDRGLVRYDGYEFKTYTMMDGLLNNGIVALFEDKDGIIWYSTLTAKIGSIDTKYEQFETYKYQGVIDSILLSSQSISANFNNLYINDSNSFYLSNRNIGSFRIDANGKSNVRLDKNEDAVIRIDIVNNNVFVCKESTRKQHNIDTKLYLNDQIIYEYNKLGYSNFLNFSYALKYSDTIFLYDNKDLIKISANGSHIISHDTLENMIRAYELKDYYLFNELNRNLNNLGGEVYLTNNPNKRYKNKILEGVYVTSAIVDNRNGLWVTTARSGLFYYPNLKHLVGDIDIHINGLIPIKNGNVIINSNRYNNYEYDISRGEILNYEQLKLKDVAFNNENINSWYFSELVNISNLNITVTNPNKLNKFSVKGVQKIGDNKYSYWVSKYLYSKYQDSVIAIGNIAENTLKRIEDCLIIDNNQILIGDQSGLYNYSNNQLKSITFDADLPLESRVSNMLYISEKNMLIFSVLGYGIYVLNHNYEVIYHITEAEGLISNTINHMFLDDRSKIWIGTNKGLSALELSENDYVLKNVLTTSMVLKSPNITQVYKKDSLLFIGTDFGITIANVNELEKKVSELIPLWIEGVKISDVTYDINSNTELEYHQNDFEISFLGISYNQHGNLDYRYKMLGLSDDWIYTKDRKVIFLQLKPGTYTFELNVQNEFGDWVSLEKPPTFNIHKPYWETWWFRILVIGILGYVIYYYVSNLKKEKNLLEDKQKLSEELNASQQKALSSQLNPHFVFNSLNSIQNFILTKRTELSSDYLSMFSKLMRFVFENSKKLYVPLSDEIEAIRLYLELEQVRHNHRFNYNIQTESINNKQCFIPSLLIQPIIENAIWHGLLHKETGDRLLEVIFSSDKEYLYIEIKDNGIGRGHSQPRPKFIKKQRSSGIKLTQERLRLLSESTGLETNFEIIDLFDDKRSPLGTLVKVSIPMNLQQ